MLTQEFYVHVAGDQLLELINSLFKKSSFKYMKNKIVLILSTKGMWLEGMVELLNELRRIYNK